MKLKQIYYITSNKSKVEVAQTFLKPHGIEVEGKSLELLEMQTEDIEKIAINKAKEAFGLIKKPLFVNDASWNIPAYKGFPGPFMKYVNEWFIPEDFLHLMSNKTDRSIIFTEVNCYIDEKTIKTFKGQIKGSFTTRVQGPNSYSALKRVVSLVSSGKTIAQCWEEHISPVEEYAVWTEMAKWFDTYEG